jgi:hypothetical protein
MEELTKLLTNLADKLGTTVGHLWGVLVKQAKIEIVKRLMYLMLGILFIIGSVRLVFASISSLTESPYWWFGIVCGTIFGIIMIYALVDEIVYIKTLKDNPEYYALDEILSKINQLGK